MPLEIREIIIRATAGMDHGSAQNKKDDSNQCQEDKDAFVKQETIAAVSDMLKNNKER